MENIYFIQSGENGPIKIGTTKYSDIKKRIKEMQTGNPEIITCLFYLKNSPLSEQQLHDKFDKYRYRGEWFHPVDELIAYINELKERFDNAADHEFKRGKWSEDELTYLFENMDNKDYETMSIELNRPFHSIHSKINQFKKAKDGRMTYYFNKSNNRYVVYNYTIEEGAKYSDSFYTKKEAEHYIQYKQKKELSSEEEQEMKELKRKANEERLWLYNHPAERKKRGMRVYDFEWEQYGLPIPEKD